MCPYLRHQLVSDSGVPAGACSAGKSLGSNNSVAGGWVPQGRQLDRPLGGTGVRFATDQSFYIHPTDMNVLNFAAGSLRQIRRNGQHLLDQGFLARRNYVASK
jgi:hypothetical protein